MTVLLVDDHPLIRDGLRLALQQCLPNARILEAGTGAEAMAQVAEHSPQLIFLDIHLPEMNGLDLARRLRALPNPPRILFLAGESDPWTVQEALNTGAAGFLAKTNAVARLHEAICTVLEGKVFLCPDSAAALRQADPAAGNPPASPAPSVLTEREREVLKHIAQGQTTKAIVYALKLSPKTIETHRARVMRKLGLDNPVALTHYALRHHLTALPGQP